MPPRSQRQLTHTLRKTVVYDVEASLRLRPIDRLLWVIRVPRRGSGKCERPVQCTESADCALAIFAALLCMSQPLTASDERGQGACVSDLLIIFSLAGSEA